MKKKIVCHLHINDSEQNDVEEPFGDQLNKLKIRWGPPTEPWGTPHPNGFVEDVKPFTRTDCEWHEDMI